MIINRLRITNTLMFHIAYPFSNLQQYDVLEKKKKVHAQYLDGKCVRSRKQSSNTRIRAGMTFESGRIFMHSGAENHMWSSGSTSCFGNPMSRCEKAIGRRSELFVEIGAHPRLLVCILGTWRNSRQ